jgi:hypothetical protein
VGVTNYSNPFTCWKLLFNIALFKAASPNKLLNQSSMVSHNIVNGDIAIYVACMG